MDNKAIGHTQLQGHIDIMYMIYKYIYKSMYLYYYIFSVIVQNTLIKYNTNTWFINVNRYQVMHTNCSKSQRITFSLFFIK